MASNTRTRLSREQLDQIAAEDGFTFERELTPLPRTLYVNGDTKRVYHAVSGTVVTEYKPMIKGRNQFHNPIACLPANLTMTNFRQYTGKGSAPKE